MQIESSASGTRIFVAIPLPKAASEEKKEDHKGEKPSGIEPQKTAV
jgi:hypothetical protein